MLTCEHTAFLVKYRDKNMDTVLFEARDALYEKFTRKSITLDGPHKHRVDNAGLTLKKLDKLSMAKLDDKSLDKGAELITQWNNDSGFDFENRNVFIDEAGANLDIRRIFGRSKWRRLTRATVPTQSGVFITIIDVICELGVSNVSLTKP